MGLQSYPCTEAPSPRWPTLPSLLRTFPNLSTESQGLGNSLAVNKLLVDHPTVSVYVMGGSHGMTMGSRGECAEMPVHAWVLWSSSDSGVVSLCHLRLDSGLPVGWEAWCMITAQSYLLWVKKIRRWINEAQRRIRELGRGKGEF